MSDIYRLVDYTRNLLTGTEDEQAAVVAQILETSQRNNGKVGVTGALLYNSGGFAQVLEGPRTAVEATFERIQRDLRHSDVSVLQCEAVEDRGFPNWSMAFTGLSAQGRALWSEIAGRTQIDLSRIEGDRLFAMLHGIVAEEERTAADVSSPASPWLGAADRGAARLDVERLRAELEDTLPQDKRTPHDSGAEGVAAQATTAVSGAAKGAGFDIAILKAALAEERERTTSLRRTLDDARMALAAAGAEIEVLRQHRDVWAERAKALATALVQEPRLGEGVRIAASEMGSQARGPDRPAVRARDDRMEPSPRRSAAPTG